MLLACSSATGCEFGVCALDFPRPFFDSLSHSPSSHDMLQNVTITSSPPPHTHTQNGTTAAVALATATAITINATATDAPAAARQVQQRWAALPQVGGKLRASHSRV